MNKYIPIVFAVFCAFTQHARATGQVVPTFKTIESGIKDFMAHHVSDKYQGKAVISVRSLDDRIKLKTCALPLTYYLPDYVKVGPRTTVGIKCEAKPTWSLYIPANIKVYQKVVTNTKPLSRNHVITDSDLQLQDVNILALQHTFFSRINDVKGKVMKHSIKTGSVIFPYFLTKAKVVQKGELVNIKLLSQNFSVRMQGKALESGSKNELIKVKNLSSNRVIDAYVEKGGIVIAR